MPVRTLGDVSCNLIGKRLLGLDLGTKTIGVAVCDPSWKVAMPVETIRRGKSATDLRHLESLMQEREIGGLVIGLPIGLDGAEGPRCQSVRQFARTLEKALGPHDILFWDERLSTAAVERLMIDQLDMRRDRRAKVIDAHAAAYILQGALDALAKVRPY